MQFKTNVSLIQIYFQKDTQRSQMVWNWFQTPVSKTRLGALSILEKDTKGKKEQNKEKQGKHIGTRRERGEKIIPT